jgi:hypothetical protein
MLAKVIKLLECPTKEFRSAANRRSAVTHDRLTETGPSRDDDQSPKSPIPTATGLIANDIIANSIWASLDEGQQETLIADLRSTEYGTQFGSARIIASVRAGAESAAPTKDLTGSPAVAALEQRDPPQPGSDRERRESTT